MRFIGKETFKSLRFRLGLAFFILCVPLMVLLYYFSYYAGYVIRDQVAKSNNNLVTLYLDQIDRTLHEADVFLYNLVAGESDLLIIDQPNAYHTSGYQTAKIRLFNNLSAAISLHESMDLFFVYSANNADLLLGSAESVTFEQRDATRNKLVDMLQHYETDASRCERSWCVRQIGGDFFLAHILRKDNMFVGAWANVDRLMEPLQLIDFGDVGIALLSTTNHQPLSGARFIADNGIDLSLHNQPYRITGDPDKFLLVGERSEKGEFYLNVLIPEKDIVRKLPLFQRAVYIMPLAFIFFMMLLLLFMRSLILRPIGSMVTAMRRVREGNWVTHIPPTRASVEFEVMSSTFNEMISQIQKLKIDVYEEQLNRQRAELQHLQLQIKPHFFLNSLNIVYHLAKTKKYDLIMEMTLNLVEYFRYMFRSNHSFVSLEEEIRHIRNYLNIQRLRFVDHLTYEIRMDDDVGDFPVPPLVIQSFVENIIKHALTMDESIHIFIRIQLVDDDHGPGLFIEIGDNGKGFAPEILEYLHSDDPGPLNGEHVGIWNVKRRLALLYQNRAKLTFSNVPEGGAKVEIRLPLQ
ncbi:sensor histidine kinase [Cohnella laeviribosi]|uniref:sensor histidine kinase n=1 Tax=Cohnella laeviribosi TaxID=380174 RepID=UPI00036C7BAE|nr:histidine kinase [Cohnella laeviribosi]